MNGPGSTAAPLDVLVRGSGAVAMAAALALSRQGLRVALTRAPATPVQADIRAYALNAASVSLLATLKVWDAMPADARTPVYDMHVEGDLAGSTLDFSSWAQGVSELAWIVDAAELEQALQAAVRFAPHLEVVDGDPAAALQILAEGKHSTMRERLGVRMTRHAYGQRAIAARLTTDQAHAGLARQWFRSPDVLALLPIDRPLKGRGLALVWSLPDERADVLMAADDAEFLEALMQATGGAAGQLSQASHRSAWPLSLSRAEPVCGPGWVLLGDAAHVVHPLAGQGLNLGLSDVSALAEVIAGRDAWRSLGDVRLLREFARRREGPTSAMAGMTDGLLHLFASEKPLVKELRNRGLTLLNRLPMLKRALTERALGT